MNNDDKRPDRTDDGSAMRLDPETIDEIYARLAGRLINDLNLARRPAAAGGEWQSDPRDYVPGYQSDAPTDAPGWQAGAEGPEFGFDRDASAELLRVLAQAQLSWLTRGYRYWGQMAEIQQGIMSAAIESLAAAAGGEPVEGRPGPQLEEEVTRYLRELSELSSREARLLQMDLEKLAHSVRETLGEDRSMDSPHRWARAKS